MELGPGVLKGNKLERTGPKRYKIGGKLQDLGGKSGSMGAYGCV